MGDVVVMMVLHVVVARLSLLFHVKVRSRSIQRLHITAGEGLSMLMSATFVIVISLAS